MPADQSTYWKKTELSGADGSAQAVIFSLIAVAADVVETERDVNAGALELLQEEREKGLLLWKGRSLKKALRPVSASPPKRETLTLEALDKLKAL